MALTSRERIRRAICGETTDCLAVAPYMYDVAAEYCRIKLRDFYSDPRIMADSQLALHEAVDQDVISIGCDNAYLAEGFGCQIRYEADEIPSIEKPAVEALKDVFSLVVPDPSSDGRMPVMLEAIRLVRQAVGETIAIRSPGTGPFALAGHLLGTQQWLYEIGMAEAGSDEANETAIQHLLDAAADALIRFGQACSDAGADVIHCGDSLASCDMISPQTYRRFAWPQQRRVIRAWKDYGVRATLLHICGDSTQVLKDYAATGADLIEVDHKVHLGTARQSVGEEAALIGNLDPVCVLLQGTPETVRSVAKECIQQVGPNGRYILGSGCIVPRHTPVENLREMVGVARQYV